MTIFVLIFFLPFFQKLTKGKDSWSLAEVVHAIVILTHFHSLCSFVFSCGVNQEIDQAGGYQYVHTDDYNEHVKVDPSNTNVNKSDPKEIPISDRQGKHTLNRF